MLRVAKLADYGLIVANYLVGQPDGVLRQTEEIARETRLPLATVRKILKLLVDGNVLASFRGVHGGYKLSRPARELTVAEIITAIEGPIAVTECCETDGSCDHEPHCSLKENWSYLNQLVAVLFQQISLAEMAEVMARKPSINVKELAAKGLSGTGSGIPYRAL